MAEEKNQKKGQAPQQDLNQLLKVRREKLAELQEAGQDPFVITKYDVTCHTAEAKEAFDAKWPKPAEGEEAPEIPEEDRLNISIAGRLMSKRVMGKASFGNLQDLKGNIQLYVTRDELGEDAYKAFKRMDIGDIVGVKGYVFRTKTGEISVHAKEVTRRSSTALPIPISVIVRDMWISS